MNTKKLLTILLAICLLFTRGIPVLGIEGIPTPPPVPTVSEVPPAPTLEEILAPTSMPAGVPTTEPPPSSLPLAEEITSTPSPEPSPVPTLVTYGVDSNSSEVGISETGKVGETNIQTGDVTNSVSLTTEGNTNLSSESGNDSVLQTTEESNADSSGNDQRITVIKESSITQNNQTSVVNTLEESTVTGGNSASLNVGDSTIITGDANTSGTIITAVNTNISGVAVAEFNVVDDQVGDIVLDFGTSTPATVSASPLSNASEITQVEDSQTFQNNEAILENNLILVSDTGNNETSLNTNGDSSIETGDATVSALVLSFVNNNLAGNIVLGVVNVFGNLVGDIILPEEELSQSTNCESTPEAEEVNILDTETTFQSNEADIENNLILVVNTGENEASRNTGGETSVQTGEAQVQTQVVNVANANIDGGSWWLVIVNEAGKWIGKILGFPEDSNFASVSEAEIRVDESGQIIASSQGEVSQKNTNSLEQSNQAKITNNIELAANTGRNKANDNTGGNSSISTGDAKIFANIINFVNTNISSDSKLIVTVINVFGSWIGDFLPPGYEKEKNDGNDDHGGDDDNNGGDNGNNGDCGNSGGNGDNGNNGNNENKDGGGEDENKEPVSLAKARRLKGGTFVYHSYESYEIPEGRALAAQSNDADWENKPVRVNLAWLTLTIPLFLLALVLRRIFFTKI